MRCEICPLECDLGEGQTGPCGVRRNDSGFIRLFTYGMASSIVVGPIEQRLLYHFHPGERVLSVGSTGCNMRCKFCQNFEISQHKLGGDYYFSPEVLVDMALSRELKTLSFTYSEPLVWYEYVLDTAKVAKKAGLNVTLKTNGFASEHAFEELLGYIDAVNIDVKGDARFYREICGMGRGTFELVMSNLRLALGKCHTEVSVLVVPGMESSFDFVSSVLASIDPFIPLHLLKFIPDYKMKLTRAASDEYMILVRDALRVNMPYVYVDFTGTEASTFCPGCKTGLVKRLGSKVDICIEEKKCPSCERIVDIMFA